MSTQTIAINGFAVDIEMNQGSETTQVNAEVTIDGQPFMTAETKRFSGFCNSCIAYRVTSELLATRRGTECADISDKVAEVYGDCDCDD